MYTRSMKVFNVRTICTYMQSVFAGFDAAFVLPASAFCACRVMTFSSLCAVFACCGASLKSIDTVQASHALFF